MKLRKCVVLSDSFKGSLTSGEIGIIVREEMKKLVPDCDVTAVSMADGGEGTCTCLAEACGGAIIKVNTITGPLGDPICGAYALLPDGTAVIEMASAAGLPLVEGRENPMLTTTFGVGQLMAHALDRGAKRLVLGLGGSCTNDCGCGCAAALGAIFYDDSGEQFIPAGGTLDRIAHMDLRALQKRLQGVEITAMCDVINPMYGPDGAAFVFAPQKGAPPEQVRVLDRNLRHMDEIFRSELGLSAADVPGSGAAGAFGAGILALFGGSLRSGVDTILDLIGFEALMKDTDLVITGEGRIDSQSFCGKVVGGVAARAQACSVPVLALAGEIADDAGDASSLGVTAMFSINRRQQSLEQAKLHGRENYRRTLDDVLRLLVL